MKLGYDSTHHDLIKILTGVAIALSLSYAAVANAETKPAKQIVKQASKVEQVEVGRFAVEGAGSVNTYWITAPKGLVVIDFQRDTDSAAQAISKIKASSKPVIAMLLTHAHPDHIGGLDQFKRAFPKALLYMSQNTLNELKNDTRGYQKSAKDFLKDKAPAAYPLADRIFKDTDLLEIGGLVIEARELGKGESESATLFYLPKSNALFSGDVIGNKMTDFLLEQGTRPWMKQIDEVLRLFPNASVLRPGHGASGNAAELIRAQRAYLQLVRDLVKTEMSNGQWDGKELSPQGRKAVAAALQARYPDYLPVAPISALDELNADAVAKELAREIK